MFITEDTDMCLDLSEGYFVGRGAASAGQHTCFDNCRQNGVMEVQILLRRGRRLAVDFPQGDRAIAQDVKVWAWDWSPIALFIVTISARRMVMFTSLPVAFIQVCPVPPA